jgi:dihydrodipicolinate reductase
MTKILIVGANGKIARVATALFLQRPSVQLTLFLRRARRLQRPASERGA